MSLPALWTAVEADFQRDYGIDLGGGTLERMSWRRFRALLDNLSPYGAVAARYQSVKQEAETGVEAAGRFFDAVTSRGGVNDGA